MLKKQNKITQHGVSSWDLKKRKERTTKPKILIGNFQKSKENPQVLKILKFTGNKIDWDCKIVKGNLEKQENNFAKQFSR